jgi:glycosyltransferase involved in cell wall biosynthesis
MVSIIIPNYNHAPFLEQRMFSVLNQTYRDFEVIILDDCSTDNSRDIIEKYRGNEKISQIVYNEKNSGSTFKQWEKGINLAKGEWIWMAESDDWCELNFLDVVLPEFENDVVLSFCGSLMYCDNDIIAYPPMRYLDQIIDGNDFCKRFLSEGCYIYNSSMSVFKRQYATKIVEILNYKQCGDWHFWINISLNGKVKINGRVLNYFRKHDADVSGKRFKDGTFYMEHVEIQKLLLNLSVISINGYQRNLFKKYLKLKSQIPDKITIARIRNYYKKEIGLIFVCLKFEYFISKLLKTIKSVWIG